MRQTADLTTRHMVWARALDARDARFDGVFFVGITSTRIYCRPVCPARVSHTEYRRFFETAAAAEHAGFRPCLRCRPEMAPGRAICDAVSRLARSAAQRIAAGALNGRRVPDLAEELGVSERHLRRAVERALGVSPAALAQTHRLLLAKQLLADTGLSVTRIAYASGFQSLRRFNAVFRERYRLSPSDLRRTPSAGCDADTVQLTLSYRPPLAWDRLLETIARDALPGVESVANGCYARAVRLAGQTGVVRVRQTAEPGKPPRLLADVSADLVPVLMPLLAALRRLLDLDAEPAVVDDHLAGSGLEKMVTACPGLRVPGAFESFDPVLAALLGRSARGVIHALGDPLEPALPGFTRLAPTPQQIVHAGVTTLVRLGVTPRQAEALIAVAGAMVEGRLRLAPGSDPVGARCTLRELTGAGHTLATRIVQRALHWPDAFSASDPRLRAATAGIGAPELAKRAQAWRPWRAYAARHLETVGGREVATRAGRGRPGVEKSGIPWRGRSPAA